MCVILGLPLALPSTTRADDAVVRARHRIVAARTTAAIGSTETRASRSNFQEHGSGDECRTVNIECAGQ
jgi:hypothetical protein